MAYRGTDNPNNPHERPLGKYLRSLARPFPLQEKGYVRWPDGSIRRAIPQEET